MTKQPIAELYRIIPQRNMLSRRHRRGHSVACRLAGFCLGTLLTIATPASGAELTAMNFMDGNRLFEACEKGSPICRGYVMAIADSATMLQVVAGARSTPFCLDAGMVDRQVVDVARRYLERHPQRRHWNAPRLIVDAFAESFPCSPVGSGR